MPSTASDRLRLELQAAGENLNTWGAPKLNEALKRIEEAIADWQSLTITGNTTLTSSNYVADEARAAMLSLGGTPASGFTITIPAVEKWYWVRNETGQTATLKTSGGTGVTVADGVLTAVLCDGTDCYKLDIANVDGDFAVGGALSVTGAATFSSTGDFGGAVEMNGNKVTGLGTPTATDDAATKDYADQLAFSAALPAQGGASSGQFLRTDTSAASWQWPLAAQSASTDGQLLGSPGSDGSGEWVEWRAERITTGETAVSRIQPYYCDTTGGAFTLTLPASPSEGDTVIVHTGPEADDNTLTIGRNGSTIMGLSEDMTIQSRNRFVRLEYLNSDWKVTAS